MVEQGAFLEGDYLVMDNAAVHTGRRHEDELRSVLASAGVTLVYLPTYSPELNPCELVFARLKHYVKSPSAMMYDPVSGREMARRFNDLLAEGLCNISYPTLVDTYAHCRDVLLN